MQINCFVFLFLLLLYLGIKEHIRTAIQEVYKGLDSHVDCFPDTAVVDPLSYQVALRTFHKGDAVTIFTPDDSHFAIAMACLQHGLHVLVTKPLVKTLQHHKLLIEAASRNNVILAVEVT